ncbi:MAG: hypothetical protein ACREBO_05740 [Novosphingobium sp.]
MRGIGGRLARGIALGALALALPAPAALAQTFNLPPGGATPAPRPAGPVDSDAPIVTPRPTPAPRPTATAPAPTPSISPAPVLTVPSARPTQARPAPARVQPGAATPATTLPSAATSPSPGFAPAPFPAAPAPAPALAPAEPGFLAGNWPWLLGLLAALGFGAGGALWLRKRRDEREPVVDFERPVVAAPTPQPEPIPAPAIAPEPVLIEDGPLSLVLEANKLSATLLNTTLAYRLSVTNRSDRPLGPLSISAGMAAAQAALPVERQLALNGQLLVPKHTIAALAPGESATLSGEIRLPLALIQPIRAGEAALFIPLARFAVDGPGIAVAHTFVVGEAPEIADAALRPFRLDLGPRVYSRIGQREIVAAAA